jgi:hypothetical protein
MMNEVDASEMLRGGSASRVVPFPTAAPSRVSFDRAELTAILNLYGRMVAAGEWRDYAIDFMPDKAVFSVFRRASEMPLYRIEKEPRLARRQGAYSVVAATGLILKRGRELAPVLRVLEKPLRVVD